MTETVPGTAEVSADASSGEPIKGLIEYLAKALVDDPEPVQVRQSVEEDGEIVFHVQVGKDDLGKVIGKKGRTAKALRTLLAAAASKQNLRANMEIVEPDRDPPAAKAAPTPSDAAQEAASAPVDDAPAS